MALLAIVDPAAANTALSLPSKRDTAARTFAADASTTPPMGRLLEAEDEFAAIAKWRQGARSVRHPVSTTKSVVVPTSIACAGAA